MCDAEYPLSQALPPELIPVVAPARQRCHRTQRCQDIVIPFESGEDLVEETETYGLAEPLATEHVGEEVAEEEPEDQAAAVVGRLPLGATRLRRRPPKPWWQTIIEIVTGGAAGLLLGYYLLAVWLGPELKNRGFPIFTYLPGVTWLTTPADKTDTGSEKPAVEKSAKPKPADEKAAPKVSDGPKGPLKDPPKASPEPPRPGTSRREADEKPAHVPPTR